VIKFFTSRWTYATIRAGGYGLLAGYLILTGDWRISIAWALAFPAILLSVAGLFVALNLFDRVPKLNSYLLYPRTSSGAETALSENEWALGQFKYLESTFRGKSLAFVPAEDGLICVPILLFGIGPVTAVVGGIVFGFLHLGRFTYLSCIGKGMAYAAICYVVLPHGLLTVAVGHLITDSLAWVAVKLSQHRLAAELRSNPTVETDARNSSARGSP